MSQKKGVICNIEREYNHPKHQQVKVVVVKGGRKFYGSEGVGIDRPYRHFTTLFEAVEHSLC